MAQDYTEYLAVNVLNEQQIVSYRLLSRAMKVHSNRAKQMLYEFHRKQNAKKAGSVHATYLLTGTRRIESAAAPQTNGVHSQDDGEDTIMQSSPVLPSSSVPNDDEDTAAGESTFVRSILLAKEEHLEQGKATFDTIASIHIYSLSPSPLGDMQTLTECNRKVQADHSSEDPLKEWKQYGTIQNPNVKRRTAKRTGPPPSAASAPAAKSKETPSAASAPTAKPKETPTTAKPKEKGETSSTNATPDPPPQTHKPTKRQTSNLFKSFAKSKPPPPKEEAEDEPMTGFSSASEEEEEEDPLPDHEQKMPENTTKSKKEREAELQAMMDTEEPSPPPQPSPEPEAPKQEEEPKEQTTVENGGRRRGRRRITKKKTVKDEEGYLVTREEAAWESFSEEEEEEQQQQQPAAKKAKLPPPPQMSKGKKVGAGGKAGQGNIMSFFGKK